MATDDDRRKFFSVYPLRLAGKIVENFRDGYGEGEKEDEFEKFFDSYESSYALTLAYPDDILMETARMHGVETEGRSKNDIVKELFKKQGGY